MFQTPHWLNTYILQFVPESPRYLVFHGKEEKAKKVLALIAWMNRKQPLSGKLVTLEEKEKLLEERNENQASTPVDEMVVASLTESGNPEIQAELKQYGTLPNKEENDQTADNDLVIMSSDNESDQELLMMSDKHTHRQISFLTEKVINYYHWFLLLFKNGWWRTTLLLWYLW